MKHDCRSDDVERLAQLVMHHRRIVCAIWVVLFVAGMGAASGLSDRLSLDFSLPGQPGDTAENQMIDTYGTSSFDTFIAVVTVPEGQTVQQNADAVEGVFKTAADSTHPIRMVDYASSGDNASTTDDGR